MNNEVKLTEKQKERFVKVVRFIIVFGWLPLLIMLTWNYAAADLLHVGKITFLQAICLRLLVGAFRKVNSSEKVIAELKKKDSDSVEELQSINAALKRANETHHAQ